MPTDTPAPPVTEGRRAQRHSATEERILAAARSLLLERATIDTLSMREVARRAGFTPGALYRYFDDRRHLIEALFLDALARLGTYLETAGGSQGPERLTELGLAYLRFGRERPELLTLLFQTPVPTTAWGEYISVAWPFTLVVAAVRQGVDEGALRLLPELDEAGTAYSFWALVHGFATLESGHLKSVRGDFAALQRAGLAAFVDELRPTRRGPR
ncbi:MAG: TetR/AcrR family transcriptional regulator [Actinobacteria bacterium]|nr:TetR/AcrR family transcriptional regulator [Actinomycetota bacterium]